MLAVSLALAGCSSFEGSRPEREALPTAPLGAAAKPIDKNALDGTWTVQVAGGGACAVNLTTSSVRVGGTIGFFTASTQGCAGTLAQVGLWSGIGRQIVLADKTAGTIAQLNETGPGKFAGQIDLGGGKIGTIAMAR
jgi:hypothetical protein